MKSTLALKFKVFEIITLMIGYINSLHMYDQRAKQVNLFQISGTNFLITYL